MPHTKTIHSKTAKKSNGSLRAKAAGEKEEVIPVAPVLTDKKSFDFEEDPIVAPVDKLDDPEAPEAGATEEEAAEEEAGLDEEELNPFGDKWEV